MLATSCGHDTRKVILMHSDHTTRPEFLPIPLRARNEVGQRFGRLVVLGLVGRSKAGVLLWLCQCDCGNTSTVQISSVRYGKSKSCGCLGREITSKRSTKHGFRGTRIYRIWAGIKSRCLNPNEPGYQKYYGVRGISICDEWRDSFEAFRDHVMQLPHYDEKGYSLDRVDNDGDYEPDNVRWATLTEQSRNNRGNHLLTFAGKTQCLTAWAIEVGLNPNMVFQRIKAGWSVDRALTSPSRGLSRKSRVRLVEAQEPVSRAIEIEEQHV
jgi:hypothetical protein